MSDLVFSNRASLPLSWHDDSMRPAPLSILPPTARQDFALLTASSWRGADMGRQRGAPHRTPYHHLPATPQQQGCSRS